jgi:cell wall assembly regulator SMI1
MEALLARLDKWLAKNRARFHRNLQPGADDKALAELEKAVGRPIPQALRTLLHWHNGLGDDYVGYFVDHWLLMSSEGIAAAKRELDDTASDQAWNKAWLPFLDDDGGNFVCLDLSASPAPVIVYWWGAAPERKSDSLEAWLGDLVKDMEAGKYHEDPERGTFTRSRKK